jgi:chromosome transmission fidelity protein 18
MTYESLQILDMCSSDRELQSKNLISGKPAIEDMLWVDRYRPRKFIDLLGNERVARDALTWVKQWDWCVFGKSRGKKRTRDGDENVDLDELHRPQEKV